jgi:hypothetical protein
VSGAPAILPVLEVGTQRMAKEYCLAFLAPNLPTKPAFVPEFDWVVGCKLAELPEFCCPLPALRGASVMLTGFHPSWSSLCRLGFFSCTSLRTRRLVPIFYGNLRPAGVQTVWLLRFMLQLTT